MADNRPTIQIDDDWKKQAQEEKRRLAEQQQKEAPRPATSTAASASRKPAREMPEGGFDGLVQHLLTQALFYLGELSREEEPSIDLDMARHYIDLITVLESKTQGRLTSDEQTTLDSTLYDLRMRYVSIASQMIR